MNYVVENQGRGHTEKEGRGEERRRKRKQRKEDRKENRKGNLAHQGRLLSTGSHSGFSAHMHSAVCRGPAPVTSHCLFLQSQFIPGTIRISRLSTYFPSCPPPLPRSLRPRQIAPGCPSAPIGIGPATSLTCRKG